MGDHSIPYPSSIQGLDAISTTFLHSCLFSTDLSSSSIASPVQVLMLSIHLIFGLSFALPPGIFPCIIFSPGFLLSSSSCVRKSVVLCISLLNEKVIFSQKCG